MPADEDALSRSDRRFRPRVDNLVGVPRIVSCGCTESDINFDDGVTVIIGLCGTDPKVEDDEVAAAGSSVGDRDRDRSELRDDERLLQFLNHNSGVMRPVWV